MPNYRYHTSDYMRRGNCARPANTTATAQQSCGQPSQSSCGQATPQPRVQSVSQTCGQPVQQSCGQATPQPRAQSVSQTCGQPVQQSCSQNATQSCGQATPQPRVQSVSQTCGQPVQQSCTQPTPQPAAQTASACTDESMAYDELHGMPVAMAYVPWQEWDDIYDADKALQRGTIFAVLDKPFCGTGGHVR